MNYKYIARSPSDPNGIQGGLGYNTKEEAEKHCKRMNILLDNFYTDDIWNHNFWKIKPQPWKVYKGSDE